MNPNGGTVKIVLPENFPRPGFYYHYKHDPSKGPTHYAYEVLGLGLHTETGEFYVEYRPLYHEALVFQLSKGGVSVNDHRPLQMFMEPVSMDGVSMPRFTKVTDPGLMRVFIFTRNKMYPKTT